MANDELYHYGTKGQKWGIRRYQNPDGTLTEEGKKRYGYNDNPTTLFQTMRKNITDYRLTGTKYKGIHKLGASRHIDYQVKKNANKAKYYSNKAKSVKNKLLKNIYKNSSYNSQQLSNYYKHAQKYKLNEKYIKAGSVVDKNYRDLNTKTLLTGANITMGERYLMDSMASRYS